VQACAKKIHAAFGPGILRHQGYRQALIAASIVTHAALAAYSIRQEISQSAIQIAYGVYLLETRQVWTPYASEMGSGLTPAPRDAAAFVELGDAILQSDRIASLIRTKE
jgi:carbonic anhydrase